MGLFTSACLNITDSCNLKCKYCFVQQKPHFMTKDIAFKCVDYLYNNIIKQNRKKKGDLTFFGGEPLLMYREIIIPTVLYSE